MTDGTRLADAPQAEFIAERLVRFSDCDPSGIVFFPNYFLMLNGVVEDWWGHIGKPWTETIGKSQMGTPTVHLDATFVAPSFFGETLRFCLSVQHLGTSSLSLSHRIVGPDGKERLQLNQRLVATSLANHRSMPWPQDIRDAILEFNGELA